MTRQDIRACREQLLRHADRPPYTQPMLRNAHPPPPDPPRLAREVDGRRRWRGPALAAAAIAIVFACGGARPQSRVVVYDVVEREFLMDTCAGGRLTPDIEAATYYASPADARAALRAAELDSRPLKILELH